MILHIYISRIKNIKFPPTHVVTVTTLEPLSARTRSIKPCMTSKWINDITVSYI